MNVLEVNVLVLAYLGDTIYENYVRRFLIERKIGNANDLQKASLAYVSAKSQATFLMKMLSDEFLTEEEVTIVKRARNNKSNSHPKSCDIMTYKYATGLEAVIGYLELAGNKDRVSEIMAYILKEE